MNNVAALLSAYGTATLGVFGGLSRFLGSSSAGVAVASFLCAAMVAHILAESVTSTYVGVPAGDVVSVLPAHRLAKAGLGRSAVRASADGALTGILGSTVILVPMSLFMGGPIHFYRLLSEAMGIIVIFFAAILVVSEGARDSDSRAERGRLGRVIMGLLVFSASGVLGFVVLKTEFYSRTVPDLPWLTEVVPRDSLLLPMFAGMFGIPSLILSIGSGQTFDLRSNGCVYLHLPGKRDLVLSLLGGTVVGWMPGMTSGAAATLCAPTVRETTRREDIGSSLRFIWLYSSISAAGAVFSLGALFSILRARSGTMDALQLFLGSGGSSWPTNLPLMLTLATSMIISAITAHAMLRFMDSWMRRLRSVMGSRAITFGALVFITSLSIGLTGIRGSMILGTSVCLGLLPPLAGVRRIQLMGCLLVPIAMTLLAMI